MISDREPGATNIHPADVNGDGRLDFIASRGHGKGVIWFEAPHWKCHDIDANLKEPHCLAAVDMDSDGDLDMLAIDYDSDNIFASYVYYENISNNSVPDFKNPAHNPFNLSLISDIEMTTPTLTDYDSDGDLDLFVTSTSDLFADEFVMPKTQLFLNEEVSKVEVPTFQEAGIKVYPNPATDIIQISSEQIRTGNLILYNMQGKVVQHRLMKNSTSEDIDISNLPTGNYILYFEDQDVKGSKKLIIE